MTAAAPIEPADAELAQRVTAGPNPTGALEALFARHQERLLAFLLARYREVAEDVAHDAWIRVFETLRSGPREMTNFRAFLFQIARNAALDILRRKQPGSLAGGSDPESGRSSALDDMLDTERRDAVHACIQKLPRDQQEIFVAALGGEEEPGVTASRLKVSMGIFYQRKSRGLEAIRECVKKRLS